AANTENNNENTTIVLIRVRGSGVSSVISCPRINCGNRVTSGGQDYHQRKFISRPLWRASIFHCHHISETGPRWMAIGD
ncbi:MAG: hypothetical protein M3447_10560, partial [Acidobacteriota bacterium]|nr:hypothetical protein [Acidobacteriota bacterium]